MQLRAMKETELAVAAALADLIFRDDEQTSMGDAFPPIFQTAMSHSFGAFAEDGRLAAFMGLVPSVLRIGNARLNVFSIGSVCTHPDFRGQGLASRSLELCKAHADASGASLIFVSGDRSLYTRAHCNPFGRVTRFTPRHEDIGRLRVPHAAGSGYSVRPFERSDIFALQSLVSSRVVAFERSVADLGEWLDAAAYASRLKLEHRVLVALDGAGRAEAYAVLAVPGAAKAKSSPVVIEWAGSPAAMAALLADALERYELSSLGLTVEWHEGETARLFQEAGLASESAANAGTVYIVNADRLYQQAQPYGSHPTGLKFTAADAAYRLEQPDGARCSSLPPSLPLTGSTLPPIIRRKHAIQSFRRLT
ncbi:GNAT family N-acetyltransferase [Paenibacillus sp. P26]|nr:GNAT family N-acetyltransferase [Paenibacillus sp. P26]